MYYCGVDMIEISRIKNSMKNPRFLKKILGSEEREALGSGAVKPDTVAAAFAAKEAFAKALGTGIGEVWFSQIQVLHKANGKPYLYLIGNAKKIAEKKGLKFDVSVTHCKEYATAVVIAYKDGR